MLQRSRVCDLVKFSEIQEFVEANVLEHPEEMEPIKLKLQEFQNMLDDKMQKANDIATDWLSVTDALSELQVCSFQTYFPNTRRRKRVIQDRL